MAFAPFESIAPAQTERRFRAGNEIIAVFDAWAARFQAKLIRANRECRRYKSEELLFGFIRCPWYVEIEHDGQCFTLSAWMKTPTILRWLTLFRLPRAIPLETARSHPFVQSRSAFMMVNTLFKKLSLTLMEDHAPSHLREWSTPTLAALLLFIGASLYFSVTGGTGFSPGLYIPPRGLKLGIFFAMLIPAITALGLHYWVSGRRPRPNRIKAFSVFLGVTYFLGAFTWGLQRSGTISLILLNETGYYCVQQQDSDACEKARAHLTARPLAERQLLVKYADTLLKNYQPTVAAPEE